MLKQLCRRRLISESNDDDNLALANTQHPSLADNQSIGDAASPCSQVPTKGIPPAISPMLAVSSPQPEHVVATVSASGKAQSTQDTSQTSQSGMQAALHSSANPVITAAAATEASSAVEMTLPANTKPEAVIESLPAIAATEVSSARKMTFPATMETEALTESLPATAATTEASSAVKVALPAAAKPEAVTESLPVTGAIEASSAVEAASEKAKAGVPVLLLLSGPPGSGKSTFCEKLIAQNEVTWVRVNQDSINAGKRRLFGCECVPCPVTGVDTDCMSNMSCYNVTSPAVNFTSDIEAVLDRLDQQHLSSVP